MAMTRTPLFSQHTPGGVFNIVDIKNNAGNIFFVDSGHAAATDAVGGGRNPDRPLATLDYAIGLCTANNGDVIYVMPGHAETLAVAGAVTADMAGISIIGLGRGADRPTFTYTDNAATFIIGAANITVANLLFVCNVTVLVRFVVLNASGDGAHITGCEFREGTQTGLSMVEWTGAADDVEIDNCLFYAPTAGNYDEAILIASTPTRGHIHHNFIYGDFDEGGVNNAVGNIATLFEISNNQITNLLTNVPAINLDSAVTGMMSFNAVSTDTYATAIDSGVMRCNGNMWSDATADTGGIPVPAVGSATADSVLGALFGTGGISSFPAGVAAGNNVSLAEVLRYIQDQVINGTGTVLDTNTSLYGILAGATGVPTFPAAAAPANNISLAEVLRAVYDNSLAHALSTSSVNHFVVTADMTSVTWNTAAAHEIATVTGMVLLTIIPQVTGTLVDAADAATIALGHEGSTAAMIAATDAAGKNGNTLATNEFWIGTTPADVVLTKAQIDGMTFLVGGGQDVGYTIAGEALTGGTLLFHIWWTPVDSTGAVVAGAGGAL